MWTAHKTRGRRSAGPEPEGRVGVPEGTAGQGRHDAPGREGAERG